MMTYTKRDFMGLLAAGAVAAPVALLTAKPEQQAAPKTETVYDRVMQSGVIRCAYGIAKPWHYVDPNTGQFSGLTYEITERLGRVLGLKIDWTEESGWGDLVAEGLGSNRFDLFCTGLWPNAMRGQHMDFSVPFFYSGISIYVRANDHRFDEDFEKINDPSVRVCSMDGEMGGLIAASDYPKAKLISLPSLSDFAQVPMNIISRKADAAFLDQFTADNFMRQFPGKLRNISQGRPVRVFESPFAFKRDEYEFARMINIAVTELHNTGEIEKMLRKYDGHATGFYRIAKPYTT